ncbi:hypothetical protein ES703_04690 [subsurface metagenome]
MRVEVTFFNIVRYYAGMPGMEVELSDAITLGELLQEVGRRVGDKLPVWMWDSQNQAFHRGILMFVNNEQVRDLAHPLHDGSQVSLSVSLSGG